MYTLQNEELTVSILDPVADQERMGIRYCSGGYIFMITDPEHGDILSGPVYPRESDSHNGQGIPDAFNLNPLRDPASGDINALVLGVGVCNPVEKRVVEWCQWTIEVHATAIRMSTRHSFRDYVLDIEREVRLDNRTVRSTTTVRNAGKPVPLRWFPHPFYPHSLTDECCKFNIPVRFPDNPGYVMGANGFICRRDWPQNPNFYQALDHNATEPLVVLQKHPLLGLVGATCSYVPAFFPIWGNANTFSWEPFFERSVAPSQTVEWWIDYDF